MADIYNHPERPWRVEELRNTSFWISRGNRDNASGADKVYFRAFVPRGADARDIAAASNMVMRRLKAFAKRARARGFEPVDPIDDVVRPGIYQHGVWFGPEPLSENLELRTWLYFKIGIFDAMEVP